jgi:hypothetical protein
MGTTGRERDRYRRASLREQLGGELASLRMHPGVILVLVLLFGGWLFLQLTKPPVLHVDQLSAGNCLYVHAADADTDTPNGRPAGTSTAAVAALYAEGTEGASCDSSHSHEVVLQVVFPDPPGTSYPGSAALTGRNRAACEAAFTGYIGRASEGSELELVVAVPPENAWTRGVRAAPCLVGRLDGRFLGGPAKGSGL